MFSPLLNDWTHTKSYKSQTMLEVKLAKFGLDRVAGAIIVRTPEGRWTAIFGKSFLDAADIPPVCVANLGFKVLG